MLFSQFMLNLSLTAEYMEDLPKEILVAEEKCVKMLNLN